MLKRYAAVVFIPRRKNGQFHGLPWSVVINKATVAMGFCPAEGISNNLIILDNRDGISNKADDSIVRSFYEFIWL